MTSTKAKSPTKVKTKMPQSALVAIRNSVIMRAFRYGTAENDSLVDLVRLAAFAAFKYPEFENEPVMVAADEEREPQVRDLLYFVLNNTLHDETGTKATGLHKIVDEDDAVPLTALPEFKTYMQFMVHDLCSRPYSASALRKIAMMCHVGWPHVVTTHAVPNLGLFTVDGKITTSPDTSQEALSGVDGRRPEKSFGTVSALLALALADSIGYGILEDAWNDSEAPITGTQMSLLLDLGLVKKLFVRLNGVSWAVVCLTDIGAAYAQALCSIRSPRIKNVWDFS